MCFFKSFEYLATPYIGKKNTLPPIYVSVKPSSKSNIYLDSPFAPQQKLVIRRGLIVACSLLLSSLIPSP
jgi:hypothetical protein